MLKKWILPFAGVVSLMVWVVVMFYANQFPAGNFTRGGPDMEWLGRLLLYFSPFCLVAGLVAVFLFQHGVRSLKTVGKPSRRLLSIALLLGGVLVWLATAFYIFLGAALLATG